MDASLQGFPLGPCGAVKINYWMKDEQFPAASYVKTQFSTILELVGKYVRTQVGLLCQYDA